MKITVYDTYERPPEPQIELVKWNCLICNRENETALDFAHGDCIATCTHCDVLATVGMDHKVYSCEEIRRTYR